MRVRFLIADDQPLFRRGVIAELMAHPTLRPVGEAGDRCDLFRLLDTESPDVVVIDSHFDGQSGIELGREIRRQHPGCGVIVLSDRIDDDDLFRAIRAGAAAYQSKACSGADLARLIEQVAQGHYAINDSVLSRPAVASRVLDQFRDLSAVATDAQALFSPLTPRESEILDRIAKGNSNKEIAFALGISDQTVKNHITSILRKLAVNDRTQAVIFALRQGWIRLEDYGEAEPGLRIAR